MGVWWKDLAPNGSAGLLPDSAHDPMPLLPPGGPLRPGVTGASARHPAACISVEARTPRCSIRPPLRRAPQHRAMLETRMSLGLVSD